MTAPLFAQDVLRVATWNAELSRKGPGILLRDIKAGKDPQVREALGHIAKIKPDVLLLTGVDTDFDGWSAKALSGALGAFGHEMPHVFSKLSNAGAETQRDLDKDGRTGQRQDAQSFGDFHGQGGLVVLSRLAIDKAEIRDFSSLLWKDLPHARFPVNFYDQGDLEVLRLSSASHWDVPLIWNGTPLHLFAFYATTPVFDGDEDRNGLRNADEIAFWRLYLDSALGSQPPDAPFILLGDANLDPVDGGGLHDEMAKLLSDPRLQDPMPRSSYGAKVANRTHQGDASLDTADWDDPDPGNLRVDYVLPSRDLNIVGSGVAWVEATKADGPMFRHGLVWVDLRHP
ncbi:endonuclease/exonuclease/phosphatase family protein [Pacificibacter maritimus]|nr:endonuclease/exonuclease/phosphatase family protein [Pacificibacter maritimus]